MTKEEHIRMVEEGTKFWYEFSALCDRYLALAPEHFRSEWEMHLGELTSIYGRKTNK